MALRERGTPRTSHFMWRAWSAWIQIWSFSWEYRSTAVVSGIQSTTLKTILLNRRNAHFCPLLFHHESVYPGIPLFLSCTFSNIHKGLKRPLGHPCLHIEVSSSIVLGSFGITRVALRTISVQGVSGDGLSSMICISLEFLPGAFLGTSTRFALKQRGLETNGKSRLPLLLFLVPTDEEWRQFWRHNLENNSLFHISWSFLSSLLKEAGLAHSTVLSAEDGWGYVSDRSFVFVKKLARCSKSFPAATSLYCTIVSYSLRHGNVLKLASLSATATKKCDTLWMIKQGPEWSLA